MLKTIKPTLYLVYAETRKKGRWKLKKKIRATTAAGACESSLGKISQRRLKKSKIAPARRNQNIGVCEARDTQKIGDIFDGSALDFVYLYRGW